jgi:hypothetical protein
VEVDDENSDVVGAALLVGRLHQSLRSVLRVAVLLGLLLGNERDCFFRRNDVPELAWSPRRNTKEL